jgi:hypothetical protein
VIDSILGDLQRRAAGNEAHEHLASSVHIPSEGDGTPIR